MRALHSPRCHSAPFVFKLPPSNKVSITREFRGATYEISISNPENKFKADKVEVIVDGRAIEGNIIPDFKDGKTHAVVATIK